MGEQVLPLRGRCIGEAVAEEDVVPDGEGRGAHGSVEAGGPAAFVNPHISEVGTAQRDPEPLLHLGRELLSASTGGVDCSLGVGVESSPVRARALCAATGCPATADGRCPAAGPRGGARRMPTTCHATVSASNSDGSFAAPTATRADRSERPARAPGGEAEASARCWATRVAWLPAARCNSCRG